MSVLGELEEEPKAIFFQKSKVMQNEFALISLVTARELILEKLNKIVSEVKNETRRVDLACATETFMLIHESREATYDLIEGTLMWQQGFTKKIRPQLMSVDYLVKMLDSMTFLSSSSLRRMFVFTFGHLGNLFVLPMPALSSSKPPHKVDDTLAEALRKFAQPDEIRMINCYKILQNCMPPDDFNRLIPLQVRNVIIYDYFKEPAFSLGCLGRIEH